MSEIESRRRKSAFWWLMLATLFWGLSFPLLKAIGALQQQKLDLINSWFATGSGTAVRFGGAALILLIAAWKSLKHLTRSEIWQGFGLGFFGGIGLVFQVDGMAYTSASISAFLTQATCLFLPIIVGIRDRKWPGWAVSLSCLLVLAGVGILSGVNWAQLRIGRGELETLIAAFVFSGQILWLERPCFKENNPLNFSIVMFGVVSLLCAGVGLATMRRGSDLILEFADPKIIALTTVVIIFCTLGAYVLMNRWQAYLPATEAALIYGVEPMFASLFSLFLPGLVSVWTGLTYPNEKITRNLVWGGGLILLANVLIQTANSRKEGKNLDKR